MRKIVIISVMLLFSSVTGRSQSPYSLLCLNPSGVWIAVLQAGTAAPQNYPSILAYGLNGSNQNVALACDASGNLTPGGTAGGDLSGTYPNPTVVKVNGAVVPTSAKSLITNASQQVTASPNTYGCLDGYDHLPCTIAAPAALTAQQANLGTTSIATNVPAGFYVVEAEIVLTQAATTSSTLPLLKMICVDATDSVTKQIYSSNGGNANSNATTTGQGSQMAGCDVAASSNISFQTANYASSGATPMQFKIKVVLLRVA